MTFAPHADVLQFIGTGPAQPDRLFSQIVDKLAIGIVSGRYASGDVLPNESTLDVDVPVSRTAYREAIKFLTAKGLIEAKPKSGTRVRPLGDWNLLDPDILRWSLQGGPTVGFARDLFELRRTVEPEATRLAAIRRSDLDLHRIENALIRMETLKPMSTESISADLAFHEAIFEASGNRALACLKSVVSVTILWSQNVKRVVGTDEFVASLADHRRIYQAIAVGDGDVAAAQTVLLIADALSTTTFALQNRAPDVGVPAKHRPARFTALPKRHD
jgi:GntR family transcriptional regulator, galactonate operon transcriptional repressor